MSKLSDTLILANLTENEFQLFTQAGIQYSGSGGNWGDIPNDKKALYISTYISELAKSTKALGWIKFSLEEKEGQWIAKCLERKPITHSGYRGTIRAQVRYIASDDERISEIRNRLDEAKPVSHLHATFGELYSCELCMKHGEAVIRVQANAISDIDYLLRYISEVEEVVIK